MTLQSTEAEKWRYIICRMYGPNLTPLDEMKIRTRLSKMNDEDARRLSSRTITKSEVSIIVEKICSELGHPIPGGEVSKALQKLGPLCCCKKSRLRRGWDYL